MANMNARASGRRIERDFPTAKQAFVIADVILRPDPGYASTVNCTVDASDASTTYHVEYGKTTFLRDDYPDLQPEHRLGRRTKGKTMTGLSLETNHHFRIVAENCGGTTDSKDVTFTTI